MLTGRLMARQQQRGLLCGFGLMVTLFVLLRLAPRSPQSPEEVRTMARDAAAHALAAATRVEAPPPPGAGASATSAAARDAAACQLNVRSPPVWEESCQLLSEICVDQRTIILYGEEYQQRGKKDPQPLPLPLLQPTGKQADTYSWHYRNVSLQHPANMLRQAPTFILSVLISCLRLPACLPEHPWCRAGERGGLRCRRWKCGPPALQRGLRTWLTRGFQPALCQCCSPPSGSRTTGIPSEVG